MKQKNKKITWSSLFYNDRLVILFSLLAAFVMWILMMNGSTDASGNQRIDNIPITVEYSEGARDAGLKVYNMSKTTATVSISGNALSIRNIKAENLEVVATITENMKGNKSNTVTLSARKKGDVLTEFTISAVDPGTVTVEVDVAKELTFTIENEITLALEDNYFARQPSFSSETVTVSGPEAVVSQIKKVAVEYTFAEKLSETKEFTTQLVMYDELGQKIENSYVQLTPASVDVKLTVLWKQLMNVQTDFKNKPSAFPEERISVTPKTIAIAGIKESFANFTKLTLPTVDFANVDLENYVFTLNITLPETFLNISNYQSGIVSIDLSGYEEKWITVNKITAVNVPDNCSAEVLTDSIQVKVVGPSADVAKITEANLYAQVNLSNRQGGAGTFEGLPITVGIQGNTACWVYGSYTASATISEKNS